MLTTAIFFRSSKFPQKGKRKLFLKFKNFTFDGNYILYDYIFSCLDQTVTIIMNFVVVVPIEILFRSMFTSIKKKNTNTDRQMNNLLN